MFILWHDIHDPLLLLLIIIIILLIITMDTRSHTHCRRRTHLVCIHCARPGLGKQVQLQQPLRTHLRRKLILCTLAAPTIIRHHLQYPPKRIQDRKKLATNRNLGRHCRAILFRRKLCLQRRRSTHLSHLIHRYFNFLGRDYFISVNLHS